MTVTGQAWRWGWGVGWGQAPFHGASLVASISACGFRKVINIPMAVLMGRSFAAGWGVIQWSFYWLSSRNFKEILQSVMQ